MKIVMTADLHGNLPPVPSCDLFLIGGDLCGPSNVDFQQHWLETTFKYWLRDIDAKRKIFIAGNHDYFFQKRPDAARKMLRDYPYNCIYLEDSFTDFEGFNIYGTPWQPYFNDWAYNLYEDDLKLKWDLIPKTDILIVHGPPHGYGDRLANGHRTGSPSLTEKIKSIKPKLVVTGHIHESAGIFPMTHEDESQTIIMNASLLNERYQAVHPPIEWELEAK